MVEDHPQPVEPSALSVRAERMKALFDEPSKEVVDMVDRQNKIQEARLAEIGARMKKRLHELFEDRRRESGGAVIREILDMTSVDFAKILENVRSILDAEVRDICTPKMEDPLQRLQSLERRRAGQKNDRPEKKRKKLSPKALMLKRMKIAKSAKNWQ